MDSTSQKKPNREREQVQNGYTEQVRERERNGYRRNTERVSNGYRTDTERWQITKITEAFSGMQL